MTNSGSIGDYGFERRWFPRALNGKTADDAYLPDQWCVINDQVDEGDWVCKDIAHAPSKVGDDAAIILAFQEMFGDEVGEDGR